MVPVLCLLFLCCLKCQEGLSCLLPKEGVGPRPPAPGVGGERSLYVPEPRQQSEQSTRTTRMLEVEMEMVPALPSLARNDSAYDTPAAAASSSSSSSAAAAAAAAASPPPASAYVHNIP